MQFDFLTDNLRFKVQIAMSIFMGIEKIGVETDVEL